jgi:hypothetical protein
MAKKSRSISRKLELIYVLIENVKNNEEVKTSLFGFGYSESLFNSGEAIYTEANSIIAERTKKIKEKLQASRELRAKLDGCYKILSEHRELAKKAFSDNEEILSSLGVSRPLRRTFSGIIEHGVKFYTTAIEYPDIQEKLTPLGLTLEKLQPGLALFNEANQLNAKQEEKKGEVQKLTERRNAKLEELFKWASDLITVLRIVYKNEPQTLEQFEVLVYSENYSPKTKSSDTPPPETPPETPPSPLP